MSITKHFEINGQRAEATIEQVASGAFNIRVVCSNGFALDGAAQSADEARARAQNLAVRLAYLQPSAMTDGYGLSSGLLHGARRRDVSF